jgi:hypothetical protein
MAEPTDTYIDKIAFAVAAKCGMSMFNPGDRRLLRIYAVLVLVSGTETTKRDVHDAWAAWAVDEHIQHKSLKQFHELKPEVQDLDEPYRQAIVEVAREMSDRAAKALA